MGIKTSTPASAVRATKARVTASSVAPPVVASGSKAWTKRKQKDFLAELALSANVRASARAIGLSEQGAYALRRKSPEFHAAWQEALREGYERLEGLMLSRALEAFDGETMALDAATKRMADYSNRLALSLLASHRASVKGIANGITPPQKSPDAAVNIDEQAQATGARLKTRLNQMRDRLIAQPDVAAYVVDQGDEALQKHVDTLLADSNEPSNEAHNDEDGAAC